MRARFAAFALLVVAVPAARAAPARIAVLEVRITGDAPPELAAQVERSLIGGLTAAGADVAGRDQVERALRGARGLLGCTSTTCLARIGDRVGAARFVRATVDATGASYAVELELLSADAPDGLVRRVERTCAVCTLRDVNDVVSRAAVALLVPPRPAHVRVITRPPGVAVTADGREVGRSPIEVEVEPGEHLFTARLPEGGTLEARRSVAAGEAAEVRLEAPPVAARAPAAPSGRTRLRLWKWVAAGGAVASLGAGVTLVALDGRGLDCAAGEPCRRLYRTLGGGLALCAVAVALGGLAGYLWYQDVAVAPTRGGLAVAVGGRF